MGNEFPTIGRPPEANLAAQMKEFLTQPVSLYPFVYPPSRFKLDSELLLFCWSLQFSRVSLTLIFPTPFLTLSALFYKLPSMGLSWWWRGFLGWWGPYGIYSWPNRIHFSRYMWLSWNLHLLLIGYLQVISSKTLSLPNNEVPDM